MKKLIVIGASSGIGLKIAGYFADCGWRVGTAARRTDTLKALKDRFGENTAYTALDVTSDDAEDRFLSLIEAVGGMDYLLYSAGCGWQNPDVDTHKDMDTVGVNVSGFTKIINAAYKYYANRPADNPGHIAVITSVAGTKGLGISASYSATKRYQWTYLQALDQLAHIKHVNVKITDIRPGFIDTPLLANCKPYPMEMTLDYAAKRIASAMLKGKRVAVVDYRWAAVCTLWRCIPDRLWRRLSIISQT